jgi:indole-3-glycerol phosphate synthase
MLKVQFNRTGTILDAICERKVEELVLVSMHQLETWRAEYNKTCPKSQKFAQALISQKPTVIAEIKKGSPSEGTIRAEVDVEAIAKSYQDNGASAISVVTDKQFFQGDISWIKRIKRSATLPVIRKDFVLDEKQVYESKAAGADALLLIAAILDEEKLSELYSLIYKLGMEALVEIHTQEELQTALNIGAEIIGINNRNLKSFNVDNSTFSSFAKHIPEDKIVVAESGIHSQKDLLFMKEQGADAVLIGTHFMRAPEPGKALAELISVLK